MGCSHSMIGGCSFIEPEDANNRRKDGRRPRGGKTAASAIAGALPSPSLGVVDVRATGRKMAWSPGWMLSRASAIRRRRWRRKRGETYEERCGLENKSWLLTYAQAEAPPADPHSLHTSFPFRSGSQAEGASELPGAASVVAATTVLLFANLEDEGEEAGRGEGDGEDEGEGVGKRQSLELLERSISPFAGALVRFSYAEILSATWGFSKGSELGRGTLGRMYKGSVGVVRRAVAIKRVEGRDRESAKAFCRELMIASSRHNDNIVPLLGFCVVKEGLFLVSMYFSGGSFEHHLHYHERRRGKVLPWEVRYKVALGVARAVELVPAPWYQQVRHS